MNLDKRRELEHAKYHRAYAMNEKYRMKSQRMQDAVNDIHALPIRGAYLDISCGRGEMLRAADKIGFGPIVGTEIVPELIGGNVYYAEVHKLPFLDNEFNVVTMFDVIEHLIPGDDELACREMKRVARNYIVLTANNKPSFNKAGDDLHINKRDYQEWDNLFREWFSGCNVTWISGKRHYISEAWRIAL